MIRSMTGFGHGEVSNDKNQKVTVEMKSVNHRYCDISLKLPKKLAMFEANIRNIMKEYASRGKIDIYVSYEDLSETAVSLHYNQANGITVVEFSIGFGPKLIHFRKGETEYCIKALPFGGACTMLGDEFLEMSVIQSEEDDDEELTDEEKEAKKRKLAIENGYDMEKSFSSKSVWARIAVIVAGPVFNFLLAFVCAVVIVGSLGYDPCDIDVVKDNSPATEAGLQEGDVITKVNGHKVTFYRDFYFYRAYNADKTLNITFTRDGEKMTTTVTPQHIKQQKYQVGIMMNENCLISSVTKDSPAEKAGLKANDVIKAVDGTAMENSSNVTEAITSTHTNKDFDQCTTLVVPYNLVVSGKELYVYLVTNEEEVSVLKKLHQWDKTLPDIGLKMKTGLTVDFRNRDILRDDAEEGAIPLFYSQHIKEGVVQFPIQKEHEYVVTEQKGLMQDNHNYLFVKRFTAKEEPRRLQCGVYLSKKFPQYSKISTQNKINFIDGLLTNMSECLVYGLYVLFNSTIYDEYYRILNGSTQVNSTEINAMPVPDINIIQEMGRKIMKSKDMSEKNCNIILEGYCG